MATVTFSYDLDFLDGVDALDVLPQDVKTEILTTPTKLVANYQIADINGGNFSAAPGFTADFGVFVKNLSTTTNLNVLFRLPSMANTQTITLAPGEAIKLNKVQNAIGCFIQTVSGTARFFSAFWGT